MNRNRLNTLTGGHPLGGIKTLYPPLATPEVSIPSQAGILLAVRARQTSQVLAYGLNTLTGGHPLGGAVFFLHHNAIFDRKTAVFEPQPALNNTNYSRFW